MALALFDLDHTLLSSDSDSAWWAFLFEHKLVDVELYQEKVAEVHRQYHLGELNIYDYFLMVGNCLKQFDYQQLLSWREKYIAGYVTPMVQKKAIELVESHRNQGDTLVLITATHNFIAEPIAKLFSIEHMLSSKLEINNDGFTGNVADVPCFQQGKITHLKRWVEENQQSMEQATFYSDSHNDLPLLQLVENPVVVDPDNILRSHAASQSWPIISLRD